MAEVEKHIDSFCVQRLMANAQYVFRIMALNSIGVSEPIESEPITIKVKIGKLLEMLCKAVCSLKMSVPSPFHISLCGSEYFYIFTLQSFYFLSSSNENLNLASINPISP